MRQNYELNIITPPQRNALNGCFVKGAIPFNKGLKWEFWMDGRKAKRVKKYLELGRKKGNATLAGANKIPVVGIKDGKMYPFKSCADAGRVLRAKGIKINSRNINGVINKKVVKNGSYSYVRKKAGGFVWYKAEDVEKYKDLIC